MKHVKNAKKRKQKQKMCQVGRKLTMSICEMCSIYVEDFETEKTPCQLTITTSLNRPTIKEM